MVEEYQINSVTIIIIIIKFCIIVICVHFPLVQWRVGFVLGVATLLSHIHSVHFNRSHFAFYIFVAFFFRIIVTKLYTSCLWFLIRSFCHVLYHLFHFLFLCTFISFLLERLYANKIERKRGHRVWQKLKKELTICLGSNNNIT